MPLCIESSTNCLKPGCFLKRSREQANSLYCFPHTMVYLAMGGLPIPNPAHADVALRHGLIHFAQGYQIYRTLPTGFHYYIPFSERFRTN